MAPLLSAFLVTSDNEVESECVRTLCDTYLNWYVCYYQQFTLVTRRPYCPGRPKKLCFTTLSLAMETMAMRLSVVKQSSFVPPGAIWLRCDKGELLVITERKAQLMLKLACFEREKTRKFYFREIIRFQSVYYTYQVSEKQKKQFSIIYTITVGSLA